MGEIKNFPSADLVWARDVACNAAMFSTDRLFTVCAILARSVERDDAELMRHASDIVRARKPKSLPRAEVGGRPAIGPARDIVANPDLHVAAEVVEACQALLAGGSVADIRSVLDLQKAGIVAGFESGAVHSAKARARRQRFGKLIGLYLLFAAAIGTSAIAVALSTS